jgi:hypothetical protein
MIVVGSSRPFGGIRCTHLVAAKLPLGRKEAN